MYAFDKLVVPLGATVTGQLTKIGNVPNGKRTLDALDAEFTPARKIDGPISSYSLTGSSPKIFRYKPPPHSTKPSRRSKETHPETVLLDVQLGAQDGLELATWIRRDPTLRAIPVIAVTAHAMLTDYERVMRAGCSACVSKPISFCQLREHLNRWLIEPAKQSLSS